MRKIQPYPQYYQNNDGTEQIKLVGPDTQIYVRAMANDGYYDYCVAKQRLNPEKEAFVQKHFGDSAEENYLELLDKVAKYFEKVRMNLDKLDFRKVG